MTNYSSFCGDLSLAPRCPTDSAKIQIQSGFSDYCLSHTQFTRLWCSTIPGTGGSPGGGGNSGGSGGTGTTVPGSFGIAFDPIGEFQDGFLPAFSPQISIALAGLAIAAALGGGVFRR